MPWHRCIGLVGSQGGVGAGLSHVVGFTMQPLPGSIRKTPFSYSLVIIRNNLGGCQRFGDSSLW